MPLEHVPLAVFLLQTPAAVAPLSALVAVQQSHGSFLGRLEVCDGRFSTEEFSPCKEVPCWGPWRADTL